MTPRLKRVLEENREQVFLSRKLFIIRTDSERSTPIRRFVSFLPAAIGRRIAPKPNCDTR